MKDVRGAVIMDGVGHLSWLHLHQIHICEVIYVESQCWEEDTWSSSQDSVQDKSGFRLRMETALLLKI